MKKKITILGSGAGSNAKEIIAKASNYTVALVGSNKPGAGILNIAEQNNIPSFIIEKERFFRGDAYAGFLKEKDIELVVLAGFLWKIPSLLIKAFPRKIINIHPALLPLHGGKGMYGLHVHQDVLDHGEKESGITIHYVDEHYDRGDIILQERCPVLPGDTTQTLAERVRQLEHIYYPALIDRLLKS